MNLQTTLDATIRYDHNLTANEKLLYSELTARMDENALCALSNQEVAKLYDVSLCTASHWFKALIDYGLVKVIKAIPRLLKILPATPHQKTPTPEVSPSTKEAKKVTVNSVSPKRDYIRNPLPADEFTALLLAGFKDNPNLASQAKPTPTQPKASTPLKANANKEFANSITANKADYKTEPNTVKTASKTEPNNIKTSFTSSPSTSYQLSKLAVKKLGVTKLLYPLLNKFIVEMRNTIINFFNDLLLKEADLTASFSKDRLVKNLS